MRVLSRPAEAHSAPALPRVSHRAGARDPAAHRSSRADVGRNARPLRELPRQSPGSRLRDDQLGAGRAPQLQSSQRRLAAGGQTRDQPMRDLPRQSPHRHAGHRAPAGSPEAHDLPRPAIAVRELSLRRAPRPAGSRLPALPQRRGPDVRGRPILRSRPHRLSAARETPAAGLRRVPPAGRRWGRSDRVSQAAGGGLRPVQTDRARQLRELPPRSAPRGLREQLRRLPQRKRLGRRQAVGRDGRKLPRRDPVSAEGPAPRRQMQELPRSIRFAAGAIQGARVSQVRRLPPGWARRTTGGADRRSPGRLRGLPFGERFFTGAVRARGARQDPVPADGRAPRDRLSELSSRRCRARQAGRPGGAGQAGPPAAARARRPGDDAPQAGARRLLRLPPRSAPGAVRGADDGGRRLRRLPPDGVIREGSLRPQPRQPIFADRRAQQGALRELPQTRAHPRRRPGGDPIQTGPDVLYGLSRR